MEWLSDRRQAVAASGVAMDEVKVPGCAEQCQNGADGVPCNRQRRDRLRRSPLVQRSTRSASDDRSEPALSQTGCQQQGLAFTTAPRLFVVKMQDSHFRHAARPPVA